MPPPSPVLVTRPAREAAGWVEALRAQGQPACALPLIGIFPPADAGPLRQAWSERDRYRALMFVSANAVEHFRQACPPEALPGLAAPTGPRLWAPGPGTAAALRSAGFAPGSVDTPPPASGQFDSESLWRVVAPQVRPGDRVLIVRGRDADAPVSGDAADAGTGREWLTARLQAAGAGVALVVAYQRGAAAWSADDHALAARGAAGDAVWLFSSSEAIARLRLRRPGQDWSAARALATHPRIAEAARAAGFGTVRGVRPTLPDVVSALRAPG
jgi:uroporphyrinogen-III synthase